VPLSEHEQRLLEQIEQALYAEDPKFASAVRSTDLRRHYRLRLLRSTLVFAAGLGLLVAGLILRNRPLELAGVLVMAGALMLTLAFASRLLRRPRPARVSPAAPGLANRGPAAGARGTGTGRTSLLARLEQRWERRWEGRYR
jgi:hypothetical protein